MAKNQSLKRIYYCGEINESFENQVITVYGWVNKKRELGGLTFIDLRDREGLLQIVIGENFKNPEIIKAIGKEYVLAATGTVVLRATPNPKIFSGKVELNATSIDILSSKPVLFVKLNTPTPAFAAVKMIRLVRVLLLTLKLPISPLIRQYPA